MVGASIVSWPMYVQCMSSMQRTPAMNATAVQTLPLVSRLCIPDQRTLKTIWDKHATPSGKPCFLTPWITSTSHTPASVRCYMNAKGESSFDTRMRLRRQDFSATFFRFVRTPSCARQTRTTLSSQLTSWLNPMHQLRPIACDAGFRRFIRS